MIVRGKEIEYARGVPGEPHADAATMIFTDGTMRDAEPATYEVYRS